MTTFNSVPQSHEHLLLAECQLLANRRRAPVLPAGQFVFVCDKQTSKAIDELNLLIDRKMKQIIEQEATRLVHERELLHALGYTDDELMLVRYEDGFREFRPETAEVVPRRETLIRLALGN